MTAHKEQLEWREGLPLSDYITMAVRDAKAALETGRYLLNGNDWHWPLGGKCGICLAGGTIARLKRYVRPVGERKSPRFSQSRTVKQSLTVHRIMGRRRSERRAY